MLILPSAAENLKANFRASERRAELVRVMPSAAENLEEVALRHRTCPKHPSLIALVQIRATVQVAILPIERDSCPFVQFVGIKIVSRQ